MVERSPGTQRKTRDTLPKFSFWLLRFRCARKIEESRLALLENSSDYSILTHMKKRTVWVVAMTIVSPWMATSCAQPLEESNPVAYPGYTGDYPGFTLRLDERFDRFDPEIWEKGDGAVGSEAMCRFTARGVAIKGRTLMRCRPPLSLSTSMCAQSAAADPAGTVFVFF